MALELDLNGNIINSYQDPMSEVKNTNIIIQNKCNFLGNGQWNASVHWFRIGNFHCNCAQMKKEKGVKLRSQWKRNPRPRANSAKFCGHNGASAENRNRVRRRKSALVVTVKCFSAFRSRVRGRNLMARPSLKFFLARGKLIK